MLALKAGRAVAAEPGYSRSITTVINTAGKFVVKDGTCARGVGGKVIGLLQWLTQFGSTLKLTSRKELATLEVSVVLNLLIQYSDTTIASCLTSIAPDVTTYAEMEAKMVAKHCNH